MTERDREIESDICFVVGAALLCAGIGLPSIPLVVGSVVFFALAFIVERLD